MRLLKVLVVVMGVLIVAGVVTLAAVIVQRIGGAASGSDAGFGRQALAVPAGARVVGAVPGDGRVAIHIELPDGTARIELVDMQSGKSAGTIAIAPAIPR